MQQREFYDPTEMDRTIDALATAEKYPVYRDMAGDPGDTGMSAGSDPQPINDRTVVWNARDDRRAYIASGKYDLVQHHEVLDAIQDAIDMTVGEIEFGMVRDYGEQINGVLVFGNRDQASIDLEELLGDAYIPPGDRPDTDPRAQESGFRDAVGLGMRFQNSFDGGKKIGGSTMGYRYICQNWMVWDETQISTIERQHVRSPDDDDGLEPDFFADIITDVFDVREEIEDVIEFAADERFPIEWSPGLIEQAGFGPQFGKRITGRLMSYEPVADEASLWELYNATTDELDHEVAPDVRMSTYNVHQDRAWNLVTTEPAEPDDMPDDIEDYAITP